MRRLREAVCLHFDFTKLILWINRSFLIKKLQEKEVGRMKSTNRKWTAGFFFVILLAMSSCFQTENKDKDKPSPTPSSSDKKVLSQKDTTPAVPPKIKAPENDNRAFKTPKGKSSGSKWLIKKPRKPENPEVGSKAILVGGRIGRGRFETKVKVWDQPGETNTRASILNTYEEDTEVEFLGEKVTHLGWGYYEVKVVEDGTVGWVNEIFIRIEEVQEYIE